MCLYDKFVNTKLFDNVRGTLCRWSVHPSLQSVSSFIYKVTGGGCMGIVVVQPLYDNFNEIREFVRAAVVELGLELNIYLTHPQVTVYKILV